MSLKAFHIVFIAASALLSLGFGVWALADGGGLSIAIAAAAFLLAVALAVYGRRFLKKVARTGYIAGGSGV